MIPLPAWIPQELWDAFLEVRKKKKASPTAFAEGLILKELFKLRDKGHDPIACLEASIINEWLDVYPPAEKKAARVATSDVARTQAALKADELSARGIDKTDLAENARKLREKFGRKPQQGELH